MAIYEASLYLIVVATALAIGHPTLANDGSCHWAWCKSGDGARLDDASHTYVVRCTSALTSQGMAAQRAQGVCSCVNSGMAEEFLPEGAEGFRKMVQADANPNGSPDDQRAYRVLSRCIGN
jgi:hypothetical protein